MRAKTVFQRAYIFDFDETIAKTSAHIHIYKNNSYIKSLTSKEYNFYKLKPGEKLDFSEFKDPELILSAKKYKMWSVIKNISNAIKKKKSTSEIYILTGRSPAVKSYIYEFLKNNGIEIDINHILTIGDDVGRVSISEEKCKQLKKLATHYDDIIYFDDDPKNISITKDIPKIRTRLVENQLHEKFTKDSDPIKDMKIGPEYELSKKIKKLQAVSGVGFIGIHREMHDYILNLKYNYILNINYYGSECFSDIVFKYLDKEYFRHYYIKRTSYKHVIFVGYVKNKNILNTFKKAFNILYGSI
jgi:uncharacterized HAD superfamily protein